MITEQQAQIALHDLINSDSYKSLSAEAKQQALFDISNYDTNGSDKIVFGEGINREDLTAKHANFSMFQIVRLNNKIYY
jgi:hypothetical protein